MVTSKYRHCIRATVFHWMALIVCAFAFCQIGSAFQDDDLGHVGFGYPASGKQQQPPSRPSYPLQQQAGKRIKPFPAMTQQELETIRTLPQACQADLPGLDFQQHKQNSKETIRLASGETDLGSHRQPIRVDDQIRTASLPAPPMTMPNPHASASASSKPKAPADGKDPHLEVFSRDAFPSAQECATCHQQIYDEWASSGHAYASVSPMFHKFEDTINKLAQGTIGYFCLRCHAPVATTMGLRRDQAIWDGPKVFREGVTCVACHRVKTPYVKTNGERRIEPGDIYQPVYGSGDGKSVELANKYKDYFKTKSSSCLLYTSPSPRDATLSRMPSSA